MVGRIAVRVAIFYLVQLNDFKLVARVANHALEVQIQIHKQKKNINSMSNEQPSTQHQERNRFSDLLQTHPVTAR